MKSIFATLIMLVLLTGQAMALAGSAPAFSVRADAPAATQATAGLDAPLQKRVCWRKTMAGLQGGADSALPPPCGSDVKNTCETFSAMPPATRQVHAADDSLTLAGSRGGGPFRPPIA